MTSSDSIVVSLTPTVKPPPPVFDSLRSSRAATSVPPMTPAELDALLYFLLLRYQITRAPEFFGELIEALRPLLVGLRRRLFQKLGGDRVPEEPTSAIYAALLKVVE